VFLLYMGILCHSIHSRFFEPFFLQFSSVRPQMYANPFFHSNRSCHVLSIVVSFDLKAKTTIEKHRVDR